MTRRKTPCNDGEEEKAPNDGERGSFAMTKKRRASQRREEESLAMTKKKEILQ